jgi:hypothetical protein
MVVDEDFPSRPFRLHWRVNAASAFGTYITLLALQALVVLTLHGSAAEVGWLNSARLLPYLLFGVVVGALVDRRHRRPIMIITDVVQAFLLAIIPLLWWIHRPSFPALLAIAFALGTASVMNGAAAMSFLPRLVQRKHLQRARPRRRRRRGRHERRPRPRRAAGEQPGRAGGRVVDAAVRVYSAITLNRIQIPEPPPKAGNKLKDLLRDIRDGVRWVYRGSGLTTLAIATHGCSSAMP